MGRGSEVVTRPSRSINNSCLECLRGGGGVFACAHTRPLAPSSPPSRTSPPQASGIPTPWEGFASTGEAYRRLLWRRQCVPNGMFTSW